MLPFTCCWRDQSHSRPGDQGAISNPAQTHERPRTDLSQNTMPALIMGVMLASTVLQQKHSMSMKLSSSGSRMWRLATSPVLVARKEARVRQAKGCLRNSAQQNGHLVPSEQAAQGCSAAWTCQGLLPEALRGA